MIRAFAVMAPSRWRGKPVADTVVLDFDDRHRRRMAMTGTRGLDFLLDLEEAVALRGGDALVLEDGRLVEVVAAPEPLIEIHSTDPQHLVRIAWHLGNRHLPVQIARRGLRIRRDHVIEDMVRGLGGRVVEIEAPFDPEGGAYAGGAHGHDHGDHDAHGHGHDHGHDHDHAHQGHGHAHDHAGCDHGHGQHAHGDHAHQDHAHHDHGHGDHAHDARAHDGHAHGHHHGHRHADDSGN
ncbi:MAG: urease accessory protein UreE [Xanthobacteraceae bacterium]|nr:urease accessory protein UreE [Xanthobacteraceae bacterium]